MDMVVKAGPERPFQKIVKEIRQGVKLKMGLTAGMPRAD